MRELNAGLAHGVGHLASHAVVMEPAGRVLVKQLFWKPEEADSPRLTCLLMSHIGLS